MTVGALCVAVTLAGCGTLQQGATPSTEVRHVAASHEADHATDDGPAASGPQRALADRLTQLLTPSGGQKPAGGMPVGFIRGIIGVLGSPTNGYTLVLTSDADEAAIVDDVLHGLPRDSHDSLTVTRATSRMSELQDAWRAITSGRWRAEGYHGSYSVDADPSRGGIAVDLFNDDPSRAAAERDALISIAPAIITVQIASGPGSRLSRVDGNSPHLGGATITSPSGLS